MPKIDSNYVLIGLGILAIVIELIMGVATGFDLFLVGLTLIIGGAVGVVTGSFSVGLITTIILLFLYVFVGRQFIKSKLHIGTKATNVESLMGKEAVVFKPISPQDPGQVKIEGEIWRATADRKLEVGDKVVIQSVSGVTLSVE